MVRVLEPLMARQRSTDKHLILSIGLVNGLRHGGYENFEPTAEARHNRCQLARRIDYFPLDEIGGGNNLIVRSIDRPAHQFDFIARLIGCLTHYFLQFTNFIFDYSERF